MIRKDSDRQPQRDRGAHHPRLPGDGDHHAWRCFPRRIGMRCTRSLADESGTASVRPQAAGQLSEYADILIGAAHRLGAEAIHPGFGLLSRKRATLPKLCGQCGIDLYRPPGGGHRPAWATRIEARKTMQQAGVPVVPGSASAVDELQSRRLQSPRRSAFR